MPKVAADNSPLLERAIFGYDGTNYRVVLVDADGNLVAALKAAQSIEVTQATAADLNATATLAADQNVQARSHGWIGAAWQKNPLSFGYSDTLVDLVSDLALSAGTNTISGATVPAGEVWVLTLLSIRYDGTVPTNIMATLNVVVENVVGIDQYAPVSGRWYTLPGQFILKPGHYLQYYVFGATLNDDFYGRAIGYKMDIDQ